MTLSSPPTSDLEEYVLTPSGWPRPVVDGVPIPWVAPTRKLSEVNEGRRLASIGGAICQVCGTGFNYGEHGYGFTSMIHLDEVTADLPIEYGDFLSELIPGTDIVMLLDSATLHHRCAKLTASVCPHVRDRAELICVRVPANDADPQEREDGTLAATYKAADCMYVSWPDPRRSS